MTENNQETDFKKCACSVSTETPCYVHGSTCGRAFVFIFKKGDEYRCLNMRDSGLDKNLLDHGWKHIATIGSDIWMESFLNESSEGRIEQIANLDT